MPLEVFKPQLGWSQKASLSLQKWIMMMSFFTTTASRSKRPFPYLIFTFSLWFLVECIQIHSMGNCGPLLKHYSIIGCIWDMSLLDTFLGVVGKKKTWNIQAVDVSGWTTVLQIIISTKQTREPFLVWKEIRACGKSIH